MQKKENPSTSGVKTLMPKHRSISFVTAAGLISLSLQGLRYAQA